MSRSVNAKISTATTSNVASDSAAHVVIAAANNARTNLIVHNDSTAILYLKFGDTATSTSHTTQVASQGTYTMPNGNAIYTGLVTGRWASTNGAARVTEY
jgi:hypothetical protein